MKSRLLRVLVCTLMFTGAGLSTASGQEQGTDYRTGPEAAQEFQRGQAINGRYLVTVVLPDDFRGGQPEDEPSPAPTSGAQDTHVHENSFVAAADSQSCDPTSDNADWKVTNIVATPSDVTPDSGAAADMSAVLAEVQKSMDEGSGPFRDQSIEFFGGNDTPTICEVTTAAIGSDGQITMNEIENDLLNQGFNDLEYRKWNVMLEISSTSAEFTCGGNPAGGCGEIYNDSSASTANSNNNGNMFAVTRDDYRELATAQEIFHTFGAVQQDSTDDVGAPHQCCGSHTDQHEDFMNRSWSDDPNLDDCSDHPSTVGTMDCGRDDYYSTLCVVAPTQCPGPSGTTGTSVYLANYYNIARDNLFVTAITTTAETTSCDGLSPDYQGDESSDSFGGTDLGEVYDLRDGYDVVNAGAAADTICGQWGKDTLHGNRGADVIRGGAGDDELHGDKWHDDVIGRAGDDVLHDGVGSDNIYGGPGNDTLHGCPDNTSDTITGVETKKWDSTYC